MKKWADVLLTTFSIQGPIRGRVFKLRTEGQQTFTEEKGGGKKDTEDIKMNMRCSEREKGHASEERPLESPWFQKA